MITDTQPDYEKLRIILEKQFERDVTLEEATNTGKSLINIYEVLLIDDGADGIINADTTNR
jgi:hypothetical protein